MSTPNRQQIDRFRRELDTFVPPRAFDVHAHLYRSNGGIPGLPLHVDWKSWRESLSTWLGSHAPAAGLFFAFPKPNHDFPPANEFVIEQARAHDDSRALMLIAPKDDPIQVESLVERDGFAGFKVYHVYSGRSDSMNASIGDFLPDWAWEIADRRQLAIMLHIVRDRALADEANQQYIRSHCLKYSQAKLILAHAARGFCAAHTVEGMASLRGLDNVFFDTSAVCEMPALTAILREFGPSRLMFGTDFPVSESVGRCVSVGDGFVWLNEQNLPSNTATRLEPLLVGIESLLAVRQACREARLTDADIEAVFRDNARALLKLDEGVVKDTTGRLYRRAKQIIPGGTQLLSKRPEMYAPDSWPAYFREARGCRIVDLDGRELLDMTTSGIGSCLLGYADPDVTDAVVRRVLCGSMCSLNAPEEVELAELLISLHPWAEQVRFCRTGGEAMAIAVRLARAASRRDVVAFCGYHGWSDWYLAANLLQADAKTGSDSLAGHLLPGLSPSGVPPGLAGTALPFTYNRIDELRAIVEQAGNRLAAVVMEPIRSTEPQPHFLADVREICDRSGASLVFDEITSGWRFHLGGIHVQFGIEPDVVVFAKALGNGHPMAAVLGKNNVLDSAQKSFVSSTYWTESVGPTAALATIRKMQRIDVPAHVARIGGQLRAGLAQLSQQHGVPITITGRDALLHIAFDDPAAAELATLFTTRMLDHRILAGSGFYPCLAHEERHVMRYLSAADLVFAELAQAIRERDMMERIGGRVRQGGFGRLT